MLLILALLAGLAAAFDIDWDYHQVSACPPESFFGTQGDFNITQKNFGRLTAAHQHLLVVVSSSGCRECCHYERSLGNFYYKFIKNPQENFGVVVKVGRVDLIHEPWFAQQYSVKHIPDLHYFYKGRPVPLMERKDPRSVLYQLYKIEHWYERIETQSDLRALMETNTKNPGYRPKVILGVQLEDRVLREFEEEAKHAVLRLDLKFGLVQNVTLVRLLAETLVAPAPNQTTLAVAEEIPTLNLTRFGFKKFEENVIYFVYFPTEFEKNFRIVEFVGRSKMEFELFFRQYSLERIEKLSIFNREFLFYDGEALLLAFLPKNQPRLNERLLNDLKQVAYAYPGLNIAWTFHQEDKVVARRAGIFRCVAPCLSTVVTKNAPSIINRNSTYMQYGYENIFVIGNDYPKDLEGLLEFFQRLMNRDLEPGISPEEQEAQQNHQKYLEQFAVDEMSFQYLKNTALVNERDYVIVCVRSFTLFDFAAMALSLRLIRSFFKKIPGTDMVVLLYDLDTERDDWDSSLVHGSVLISTKEIKKQKKKYAVIKKIGRQVEVVVEVLKLKRVRVSKDLEFTAEEKQNGINFDAIFEGKF